MRVRARLQAIVFLVVTHPSKVIIGLIAAFFLWGLLGLTQSPGFTLDEVEIIDAAVSLAKRGYLSVPSVGPGNYNDSAYLYQFPLHPVILAGVYKVFGIGHLQGRLFSLALAVICSALISIGMYRTFGPNAALVTLCCLIFDKMFSSRAREIRYDWFPLLFSSTSYYFITINYNIKQKYIIFYVLIVSILLGISVSGHVLYIIFPFIIIIFLLLSNIIGKQKYVFIFILFFILSIAPLGWYIITHWGAFTAQFLHQVGAHRLADTQLAEWANGEVGKYASYYQSTPFLLALTFTCLLLLTYLVIIRRSVLRQARIDMQAQLLVLAGWVLPLYLALVSGHKPWHHLIVAPTWAMIAGVVLGASQIAFGFSRLVRRALLVTFVVACLNGIFVSWALRSYSAIVSWGSRDPGVFKRELTEMIPDGSSVLGDYRLLFQSYEMNWHFQSSCSAGFADPQLLSQSRFDYVVLSELTASPDWLDIGDYAEVATFESVQPTWAARLPRINPSNKTMTLVVYKYNGNRE